MGHGTLIGVVPGIESRTSKSIVRRIIIAGKNFNLFVEGDSEEEMAEQLKAILLFGEAYNFDVNRMMDGYDQFKGNYDMYSRLQKTCPNMVPERETQWHYEITERDDRAGVTEYIIERQEEKL